MAVPVGSCSAAPGELLRRQYQRAGQGYPAEILLGLEIHPCVTGMGWGSPCDRGKIQTCSLSLDVVERQSYCHGADQEW